MIVVLEENMSSFIIGEDVDSLCQEVMELKVEMMVNHRHLQSL